MADDQGKRQDSAHAYLRPVMGPEGACSKNLRMVQGATVSKILLDDSTAVGVEYIIGNDSAAEPHVVFAVKEVIVSAGSYGSPKLLMLSGIGPAETLSELGIPMYTDLPVGQHAQDRPFTPNAFVYSGMPVPPEAMTDTVLSAEAREMFESGEGGPLAVTPAMATGVWGPPVNAWRGGAFMPYDVTLGTPENFGITACDLNPNTKSRATISLNSTDVFAHPVVSTNLLSQPEELERMVLCCEREREVYVGLQEQGFNISELLPGDDMPLKESAKALSMSSNNIVGSCAIGKVLDSDLKVYGFNNLRVVDASAIPDMTENSGPLGTVFMLGEYAAEQLISEEG